MSSIFILTNIEPSLFEAIRAHGNFKERLLITSGKKSCKIASLTYVQNTESDEDTSTVVTTKESYTIGCSGHRILTLRYGWVLPNSVITAGANEIGDHLGKACAQLGASSSCSGAIYEGRAVCCSPPHGSQHEYPTATRATGNQVGIITSTCIVCDASPGANHY